MTDPPTDSKIFVAFSFDEPQSNGLYVNLCKANLTRGHEGEKCTLLTSKGQSSSLFRFSIVRRKELYVHRGAKKRLSLFFIILLNSIQPLDFLVSQWQWYMISIDFVTREIIRSTTDHHL